MTIVQSAGYVGFAYAITAVLLAIQYLTRVYYLEKVESLQDQQANKHQRMSEAECRRLYPELFSWERKGEK